MKTYIAILMTLLIIGTVWVGSVGAREGATSQAVFYVQWYDVGKAALDGLNGVKEVTRGFKGFREINTVTYDANVITKEEMESALKAAGTYIKTAK